MKIRQATMSDIASIAELSDQLGYPTTAEQTSKRLADILSRAEHVVFIAETENGAAVGWVHVTRTVWLEIDAFAEIGGLVVDTSYRSKGVGKDLLNAAEAWAREHGLPNLRVRSNVIRNRAHHFYQEAGYQIIKSQHVFEKIFAQ
jgi:N-acetylglutamate synthase-like GNAT family acetyltransferase